MTDSYRSWRKYQKELPELIAAAEKNLLWLESALIDYRMTLLELSYKLDAVDVEIWDLFTEIRDEVPRLKRETLKTPLYLRNSTQARCSLGILERDLAGTRGAPARSDLQAPDTLRYYQHRPAPATCTWQKNIPGRSRKHPKDQHRLASSWRSTLVELDRHSSDFEPISLGTNILRLDDAQKVWNIKLEEFRYIEQSGDVIPEDLLVRIHQLNETVREAPTSARWIRATEMKFQQVGRIQ